MALLSANHAGVCTFGRSRESEGIAEGVVEVLFELYSNFVFVGIGGEYIHFGNWYYETEKWVL